MKKNILTIAVSAALSMSAASSHAVVLPELPESRVTVDRTAVGMGIGVSNSSSSSASISSSGSTSNSGGNMQTNAGNNSANSANGNSVTVNGDTVTYKAQDRDPVSTAYAAPLTASNGTCMGSTSGGIQGIGLGISVGSTWTDESCDMRYDAEALRAAGLPKAAQARLCQKKEIAEAMKAAGTPCPEVK